MASALVMVLGLVACSGSDTESVTLYSGRTKNLIGPILETFVAQTGISVQVRYGNSADLALLITEEGDQSPADVFLSQSPGAVGFLQAADLLAPLDADLLDRVPESVRDPGGQWVGFSGRQRVLVYNPDLVAADELPDSVFDLTGPEWRGRVGVAPANGSFQDFVTAMRVSSSDAETAEFLSGLAANDPVTYPNNNSIVAAVGRGEVDAGLVNHYYNHRFLDEDPGHAGVNHFLAPGDPGSVLIVTAAAMLRSSEKTDEATALIEFLLEAEAQRYFASETFEYPLAAGVEPDQALRPLAFDDFTAIDYSTLGGGLARTREMIRDAGLDG